MTDRRHWIWYRFWQGVIRMLGWTLWGVRRAGHRNIPRTGGVILASTHESFLDPVVLGGFTSRPVWYVARRTLFFSGEKRAWFRSWLARMSGVIEVDREGTGLGALKAAQEKLRAGDVVLMFPEGTRSEGGEVRAFRAGVGLLATRTGAHVVPVSVDGTRRVWPKGRNIPGAWTGGVRVAYGEPVVYEEGTEPEDVAADIRERVLAIRNPDASAVKK